MHPSPVTDSDQPDTQGPYAVAAADYWRAGWRGVLPLPARAKGNPPAGFTGAAGASPSWPDVQAWLDGPEAAGNLALRLPPHVLGIDVDAYGDKPGRATLAAAVARFGFLPRTWSTSSRDDGESGIRLYRVPEGLAWPGELGPGVELIQHRHRYAVAPPSIHPEGRPYRWTDPAGAETTAVPHVDDLPALPLEWIEGLTAGRPAVDVPRGSLPANVAGAWLIGRDTAGPAGQPCARVAHVAAQALLDLAGPGSSHEAARASVMRLTRLAAEGHPGTLAALANLRGAFVGDVTAPGRHGRRSPAQAEHEFATLITGAVNLLTAEPDITAAPVTVDPCLNPFAGVASPLRAAPLAAPLTLPAAPLHTPLHTAAAAHGLRLVDDEGEGLDLRGLIAGGGVLPPSNTAGPALLAPPIERTSWWPRDLSAALAGRDDDPTAEPAYLARLDGAKLLYPGRTNGLLGESESGKTWVALEAIRQAIDGGETVVMLDFEDTAQGVSARLLAMGCDVDQLAGLFRYVAPDEVLHPAASRDLSELLGEARPGLIVLDGVNAAMSLLGLELESNSDSTRFAQTLLRPLAATGAAVLTIDHLPKSRENRGKGGIGAQAKRAMMTGAAITVDVITPPAPGRTGKLSLTVDKDRPGKVRAASLGSRNVGTCVIASDADTGRVSVAIEAPAAATTPDGKFRPTVLMERVSTFLAATPDEWVSRNRIQQGVGGNAKAVIAATDRLVEEGFAERQHGRAGAVVHRHNPKRGTFRAEVVDLEAITPPPAQPELDGVRRWWDDQTDVDDDQEG